MEKFDDREVAVGGGAAQREGRAGGMARMKEFDNGQVSEHRGAVHGGGRARYKGSTENMEMAMLGGGVDAARRASSEGCVEKNVEDVEGAESRAEIGGRGGPKRRVDLEPLPDEGDVAVEDGQVQRKRARRRVHMQKERGGWHDGIDVISFDDQAVAVRGGDVPRREAEESGAVVVEAGHDGAAFNEVGAEVQCKSMLILHDHRAQWRDMEKHVVDGGRHMKVRGK
ncbi:Aste57867_18730 [Aphanomyces stellatus]|uniref:Aste57867_18730 protein n=1 Tax=Aphanomyces stellatus TaxID=120398 RepID=A0A485LB35_9STRA|nr:hypothetical protein As57867_018666 [Aphanomyces stellatus]VFT95464.1 Aste57867_18730 [Aphanomyces stellatus]